MKVETLQKITDNLIQTIDRGIEMDLENRKKRAEGLRKLGEAEEKLKEALQAARQSVAM